MQDQIRCFCARKPLLAKILKHQGRWVLHVKVHKQSRVFGEMVVTEGTCMVRCRECLRWYTIRLTRQSGVDVKQGALSDNLSEMLAPSGGR